jgi:hypothetical protein
MAVSYNRCPFDQMLHLRNCRWRSRSQELSCVTNMWSMWITRSFFAGESKLFSHPSSNVRITDLLFYFAAGLSRCRSWSKCFRRPMWYLFKFESLYDCSLLPSCNPDVDAHVSFDCISSELSYSMASLRYARCQAQQIEDYFRLC